MPTAPSCMARCCAASSSYPRNRFGRYNRSMVMAGRASAPLEQLLDVGELELDIGRAAVIALAGEAASPPCRAAARSSLGIEAASGAHAAVAGHGGEHMVEPLLRRRELPSPSASSSARSRIRPCMLPWPSSAGTSRTMTARLGRTPRPRDRAARARPARRRAASRGFGVELDHLGDQQHLAGEAAIGEGLLHPLVDQALMGGVLIDDDERSLGLGDDEGLVHLRPRRAERIAPAHAARRRAHG